MRWHPASTKTGILKIVTPPVADNLYYIILCDIFEITIEAVCPIFFEGSCNIRYYIDSGKQIIGIDKADYLSSGQVYSLVKSIIKAFIRLRDKSAYLIAVGFDKFNGSISAGSINDDILNIRIVLRKNRLNGGPYVITWIVADCDYREFCFLLRWT